MGAAFGYLAAAVSGFAYALYGFWLWQGDVETNAVTWGLWAAEATLSFFIYREQTRGDFAKYAEELVASIGCCTITILLLARAITQGVDITGPLGWTDAISAVLFIPAFGIYRGALALKDPWPATCVFQVVILVSALPIARSAFEGSSEEPLLPWVLWATGFALQLVCALMRSEGEKNHQSLLTPANYMLWHALIGGIVFYRS